jgi:hypothetical protein
VSNEDPDEAEAKFQAGTRFHPFVWEAGKNSAARIAELEAEVARLREALESCGNIGEVRVWNTASRALGGIQRESDQ